MHNFTPEQKAYVLRRGELLVDSAEWRLWGLYGLAVVGPAFLPETGEWIAFGLFVVFFGWMVFTQKNRTKRILALDDKVEEKTDDTDPS